MPALSSTFRPKILAVMPAPLAGIAFQRALESRAFALGGGTYDAPAQLVGDFLCWAPSTLARSSQSGKGLRRASDRSGDGLPDLRHYRGDARGAPAFGRQIKGISIWPMRC